MAVDTPAKIAIFGAGPIGLEAGLYARYLGYDVEIFDRGEVAENVRRWGHVRLFSPFQMNSTSVGIAAIDAQEETYRPPDADALLSGAEWRQRYLLPLSETDLLADHLRLHTTVVAVTRRDLLKHEAPNDEDRGEPPFRILVCDKQGREWDSFADVAIDATGTFGNPNWIGQGGAPARQERSLRDRIRYDLPDVNGSEKDRYANKRVLVIGGGHSAATSIIGLVELAAQARETRITWLTRGEPADGSGGPVLEIPDDRLSERIRVARLANQAISTHPRVVTHWSSTQVSAIFRESGRNVFTFEFVGRHSGVGEFDEVIANVGYKPDSSLYSELQVHECYASGGPMKLAAKLSNSAGADCLQQQSHGPESLMNPEPNFYILGAKSYGRNRNFLVSIGLEQIRELFSVIGDRAGLDLYQGAAKPLS